MSDSTTKVIGILVVAALLVTVGYGLLNDEIGESEGYEAVYNMASMSDDQSDFQYLQWIFVDGEEYDVTLLASGEHILRDVKKSNGVYSWDEIDDATTTVKMNEEIPVSAVINHLDDFEFVRIISTDISDEGVINTCKWVNKVGDISITVFSTSSEKLESDNIIGIIKETVVGGTSVLTITAEDGIVTQITKKEYIIDEYQSERNPLIVKDYDVGREGYNSALGVRVSVDIFDGYSDFKNIIVEKNTGFIMGYIQQNDVLTLKYTIKSTTFGPLSDLKYKDPDVDTFEERTYAISSVLSDFIFNDTDFDTGALIKGTITKYEIDSDIVIGMKVLMDATIIFDLEQDLNIRDILSWNYNEISGVGGNEFITSYGTFETYENKRTINIFSDSESITISIDVPIIGGGEANVVYSADEKGNVFSVIASFNQLDISQQIM